MNILSLVVMWVNRIMSVPKHVFMHSNMPGAVRSRALDLGHRARSAAARLRQAGHGLEEDWLRDTINTMMLDKLMKDSENHVLVFQPLIIDDVRFRQAQRLDKLP